MSLVHYWPCDEGAGSVIQDIVGSLNGTLKSSGSWNPASKFGVSSIESAPTTGDHAVSVGTIAINGATVYSMSMWLKLDTYSLPNGSIVLGGNPGNYLLYLDDTAFFLNANNSFVTVAHGGIINGAYRHIVTTRSGTTVRFYLDGVQIGGTQTLGANNSLDGTVFGFGNYDATAGAPGPNFPVDGCMDDIRIFNHELTAGDVSNLFGLVPSSPLVGWNWKRRQNRPAPFKPGRAR